MSSRDVFTLATKKEGAIKRPHLFIVLNENERESITSTLSYWRNKNNAEATRAPMIGPTTGTNAYPQSLSLLFEIGTNACIIRGPKSLAGLIA